MMKEEDLDPTVQARIAEVQKEAERSARVRDVENNPGIIEVTIRFVTIESTSARDFADTLRQLGEAMLDGIEAGRDLAMVGDTVSGSYFLGKEGGYPVTWLTRYLDEAEVKTAAASTQVKVTPGHMPPTIPEFLLRPDPGERT